MTGQPEDLAETEKWEAEKSGQDGRPARYQITFRSGAQITVDADEFSFRTSLTGQLSYVEWTAPEEWSAKLSWIDPGEIVAVVGLRGAPIIQHRATPEGWKP